MIRIMHFFQLIGKAKASFHLGDLKAVNNEARNPIVVFLFQ